jgi:hypothetical protein
VAMLPDPVPPVLTFSAINSLALIVDP